MRNYDLLMNFFSSKRVECHIMFRSDESHNFSFFEVCGLSYLWLNTVKSNELQSIML